MGQAVLFTAVASSALVIGAFVGLRWNPPRSVLAGLLAFASGALTAALSFELFEESFTKGGHLLSAAGLAAGALVFVAVDTLLERSQKGGSATGFALLAGVTLDGIPENLALGTTLAAGGGSIALLAAIFHLELSRGISRCPWHDRQRPFVEVCTRDLVHSGAGTGCPDCSRIGLVEWCQRRDACGLVGFCWWSCSGFARRHIVSRSVQRWRTMGCLGHGRRLPRCLHARRSLIGRPYGTILFLTNVSTLFS